MDNGAFISFVIPALNVEKDISKCLESIQGLDFPKEKFEIIVIDNNSSDRTPDVARKFTNKVYSRDHVTIAKLRNDGVKESRGNFFVFVDSDCIIPKDWLNNALRHFDGKDVGLVGSESHILPENATWVEKTWKVHLDKDKDARTPTWISARAIMTTRDVFQNLGGFNEGLETGEDFDFGQRLRKKFRIISDEKLAYIHLGEAKTLSAFYAKEMWRGKTALSVWLKDIGRLEGLRNIVALFYYLIALILVVPAVIATVTTGSIIYILIVLLAMAIPLSAISFNTCRKTGKYSYFFKLCVVYGVYILARMMAILKIRK